MPDLTTALPLRPAQQPPPSSRTTQPTRLSSNVDTAHRKTRPRPFSMQLPSLRERSNETSSDVSHHHRHERIDASNWTGTGPEYLQHLYRYRSTIRPLVPGQKAEGYTGQCHTPGTGNLTLDMIPAHREEDNVEHARQVSSSSSRYTDKSSSADGKDVVVTVQPPASPPQTSSLRLCDLRKYSLANDRLSNLRSSSVSSGGESVHGAAEDAAVAAQGWESVLTSSGGQRRAASARPPTSDDGPYDGDTGNMERSMRVDSPSSPRRSFLAGRRSLSPSAKPRRDDHAPKLSQLDGAYEFGQHGIHGAEETHQTAHGSAKRKASHFSLRSLSNSLAGKRPRLGLRKLATTVHQGLTEVRRKLRQCNAAERRNFEAWRANRRRERPGDAIKGKHEGGYGVFSAERSRHGHEDWWRDGVCKYEVPRWMVFGSGLDTETASSRATQVHYV